MSSNEIIRTADGEILVERFSRVRRIEHTLAIVTFVLLVLTGFPQKFYEADWARWLIGIMGGLDTARTIHRIAGLVFAAHAILHLGAIVVGLFTRRMRLTLLPTPQDLRDAWNNLHYYLGRRKHPPKFPKFDYRQKFEYIGLVLGGLVMISTGLILLYPVAAVSILPGEVIPAARVAHSSEALLALLVLVIWHIYGSSLSPEVFPLDRTIFTGYIPAKELKERHALEYERLFPEEDPLAGDAVDEEPRSDGSGDPAARPGTPEPSPDRHGG